MSRSEIPHELRQAAIDIAAICERHGLRFCDATLMPSHESEFHDKVHFCWSHNSGGSAPASVRLKYEKWETVVFAENHGGVKHGREAGGV